MKNIIYLGLFTLLIFYSGCSETVTTPVFNAERAFSYLEDQVQFGPRVPGSVASMECRDYYYDFFEKLDCKIDSQAFMYQDAYSSNIIKMVNVIGSFEGENKSEKGIVLMAHYDSRPRTDFAMDTTLRNEAIDGANDGASGVALLMEIGNLLHERQPKVNVDLVFVDGEDWGESGDIENYLLGSREFAKHNLRGKYRFGIVVDMIGDADQNIYREGFSEKYYPKLNDLVFNTAKDLGITTLIDSVNVGIIDDHLSLTSAGLPAIDIIDFDYQYWHTEFDTPDKCSAVSLENIGRILLEIIYNRYKYE